jgi:hypothetical protein
MEQYQPSQRKVSPDPLAELRGLGLVTPPELPRDRRPLKKIKVIGSVSDLVAEQRR